MKIHTCLDWSRDYDEWKLLSELIMPAGQAQDDGNVFERNDEVVEKTLRDVFLRIEESLYSARTTTTFHRTWLPVAAAWRV